jgi:DMSO/TMAO reductase YedYZ molybdopterin-dependent catalytic subunit
MKAAMKLVVVLGVFLFGSGLCAASENCISITGAVKNPAEIALSSLEKHASVEVQLNEIRTDGTFSGAFKFRGMPLGDLIEIAGIEKRDTDFNKPVDLAVLVRNKTGQMVTLSWGELFYKNRGNIIIATSAHPIFPHKGIDHFKNKEDYQVMMKILNRDIIFPKLIISSDGYADRSIEAVTEIEVYDLHPDVPGKKSPNAYSEHISINGAVKNPITIDKLPERAFTTVTTHIVGEGRGYHGTYEYSGIPLREIIMETQPEIGLNTVFLVSAPDAYRALLSYGELFLNPHGDRIILAGHENGKPIATCGRVTMILPDDLMADREVKALKRIEVISLENRNK